MKVKVLTDNTAGQQFIAEHGLSFYVEFKEHAFLLDTGSTDVFIKNAEKLKLNLQQAVDTVFLSHGHWDHGNGLRFLKNKTLIAHPDIFMKRFHKGDTEQIGLLLSREEIESHYHLTLTKEPYQVFPGVYFLGEIPRKNSFESKTTMFINEFGNSDFVPDDSAICFAENNSLVILSGCSHSGICNIVDHAMQVTGINKVKAVMGGFHLRSDDTQTNRTIRFLKKLNVQYVFPSHCTDLSALSAFSQEFEIIQIKTGMTFDF